MSRPASAQPLLAPFALAAFVGLAAACTKHVEHGRAEDLVRSSMRAQGLELGIVVCPVGVDAKPGATFACTAKDDDGTVGTFDVRIEADETFSLRLRERYVDQTQFATDMQERIAKEEKRIVEVHCPKKVVIVKAGVRFECELREGGRTKRASFTYKDDAGSLEVKID